MQTTNTTEQQIIEAARKIFMHRGLTGARMQDIADEAGINKAMLHYYYRSKDKLFDIVLTEAVDQMLSRLNAVFSGDLELPEKIRSAVDNYITGISENPFLPLFVLNEINQNPHRIAERFLSAPNFPNIRGFAQQLLEGMEKGTLRKVDPVQLMISIISMCIFPFLAKPLLQAVFTIDDPAFLGFMEERKVFVTEFVLNALRP
ncbi:TetR/AcrR family transcriptional regulator [Chitinophaga caseinilytica]|uniref:TetR/AcrR family transcriptional regulator n=1 Tax=Chitinophaga caseinilytica TaxID=2267521 RepID=A0ABZ2Z196_9BACT